MDNAIFVTVVNVPGYFMEPVVFLQSDVTFSLSYEKNNNDDDIKTCASEVERHFKGVGGSLAGATKLKVIQPSGLTNITAAFDSSSPDNGFSCDDGELLQGQECCKCPAVLSCISYHNTCTHDSIPPNSCKLVLHFNINWYCLYVFNGRLLSELYGL